MKTPFKLLLLLLLLSSIQEILLSVGIGTDLTTNANESCQKTFRGKRNPLGNFSTPNYPLPYPNNTECTFTFIKQTKKWLIVNFTHYDLYNDADNVTGYAGNSSFTTYHISIADKKAEQITAFQNPYGFYSSELKFTLQFTGHYNDVHAGFLGTYEFVDNICDRVFVSDKQSDGVFTSVYFPGRYLQYLNCTYEFVGKPEERVQIVFDTFSLFKSNRSTNDCEAGDSVLKYERYGRWIEICGEITLPILSDESNFTIVFNSFSIPSDVAVLGFKATYSFTKNLGILGTADPDEECVFEYDSSERKTGFINSPNFPGWYPMKMQCNYYFIGQTLETVRLNFTDFNLPGFDGSCLTTARDDYISFTDRENDPIVGYVLCGSRQTPFELVSNTSVPVLIFMAKNDRYDSEKANQRIGFMAYYEFIDASCEITYNSSSTHKNGYVSSPSFPASYPADAKCDYYFEGESGERIRLNFTYFHLPISDKLCSSSYVSDYVSYSESNSYKEQVLCGDQQTPMIIESSNSSVRLSFKGGKNPLEQNYGFAFTYEFFNEDANGKGLTHTFGFIKVTILFWMFCFYIRSQAAIMVH